MCEVVYEVPKAGMSYEGFVTILLTALAVMLAVFAIGVAFLAVWGYAGFSDAVKKAVGSQVESAMDLHLRKYPDAAKFIALFEEMENRLVFLDTVQNKIVNRGAPKTVAVASNSAVQEEKAKPVPVPPIQPIEAYPGGGQANANAESTESTTSTDNAPDAGADHS